MVDMALLLDYTWCGKTTWCMCRFYWTTNGVGKRHGGYGASTGVYMVWQNDMMYVSLLLDYTWCGKTTWWIWRFYWTIHGVEKRHSGYNASNDD